jgi:hypothetical protein
MNMNWVLDACTLPTAEQPLRVAEFDTLFAEAARGVRRVSPELLRFDLAPGPDVAARAAELVARETSCCSFFTFTLTADGAGLRLDVAVPGSRTDVLDALAGRVAS